MWSRTLSAILSVGLWLLLISLILAAILNISGRTLVGNIDSFKAEIEQQLADYGITGVSLENVTGSWQGFHPLLRIKGASISIPGRSQALTIPQLDLSVKLIPSILGADLKLESFHAYVEKLILVHDKQGRWWLNDIPLNSSEEQSEQALDILTLFERLPDFVSIDIGLAQVRDDFNDIDYLIQNSAFNSSRKDGQLAIKFVALLPATLGEKITVSLKGNALQQRVYVKADNLNLVRLLELSGRSQSSLSDARMDIRSWVELENYKILKVSNVASLTQVQFSDPAREVNPLSLKFKQKIEQDENSWRVHTRVDEVLGADREFSGFESQLLVDKNSSSPLLWMSDIRVREWRELFAHSIKDASLRQFVNGIAPDALLQDIVVQFNLEQPQHSMLGADFIRFNSQPHHSTPGIKSISGRLIAAGGNSRLNIDNGPMEVEFTSLLREPLHLDEFKSSFNMTLHDTGLLVEAESIRLLNPDVSLEARAWMEITWDQTPFLSLRASYRDGNASATGKYLPVSIMSEETVDWLDNSIKGGRITEGGLLFHGRLQKLFQLENEKSGEFHALFDVEDPNVKFLKRWPSARQGKGQVSFHNLGMNIKFNNVQFSAATIDDVELSIPDFLRSQLIIKGNTKSSADVVLNTLAELPVLKFAREVNKRKQHISGLIDTSLELRIPLSPRVKEKLSIQAKADLFDVDLSIPEWMVEFNNVKGTLEIENDIVTATALEGLYYGDKAHLAVTTDSKKHSTVFDLKGKFDSTSLTTLLPQYLQKPVKGISPWSIQVSVANKPDNKSEWVKIHAQSNLVGTSLAFPEPFKVAPQNDQPFVFSAGISPANQLDFKASLIDRAYITGQMKLLTPSGNQLSGLQINFSTDDPVQKKPGYWLSGHIGTLQVQDWNSYIHRSFDKDVDASSVLKQLQLVDVTIDEVIWTNQRVTDSKINLLNNGAFVSGEIESSHAKGRIRIPFVLNNEAPLKADLKYLRLYKSDIENDLKVDIRDMPNLHIKSKIISYEQMEFSDFMLKTQNAENKFNISQLDFARDSVFLKSSGHWQYESNTDEHVSVFNINIQGEQFGEAVDALGLGTSIRKGDIDFNGQIGWAGTLFDVNWPSLIGEVELTLTDGYLVDVDPGAGRLVGLMSFSALPKRLGLDFGDVLSEGMQFDEIHGVFNIKGEVMTTTNAMMDGASATVNISGSTNLREQTYSQRMVIIPKVGDTLPVLGTLAAGSSVGWGLLLLQKIFKDPIDKSVEIEYKISGSWDEPDITLISKPEPVETIEGQKSDESS